MKVSLIWLGLITIGIILLLAGFKGYEAFTNYTNSSVKEGFQSPSPTSELQLTTCPADSKSYIDNDGRTVCCQGSIENGKCVGRPICTLSEVGKDLPTCNTWYAALLEERGRDRCPASMTNYFEGGKMGRGCTAGKRNKDGTAPDLSSAKFCKLYTTEKDELLNEDSCSNQKLLEQTVCPVPNAKKKLTKWHPNIPQQVQCEFINPTNGLPSWCSEDVSTFAQHQYAAKTGVIAPNWQDNYSSHFKITWCRLRKMVDIDKTLSYDDLKHVSVDPNSSINIPKPPPPPPPAAAAPPPPPPKLSMSWKQVGGKLKQVEVDKNIVCGVNSYDDIYCADSDIFNNPNWMQIPGKLKHVAVSNGRLYGVNSYDDIYYKENYKTSPWIKIPGKLKQVDIDDNKVCGVNSYDDIWCKDDLQSANWFKVPGKLKHVTMSNGKLYGVNSNNNIYYKADIKSGNWVQISGALKQVSLDGERVCGVASNDTIWCKDNLTQSNWTQMDGRLKYISTSNKKQYGVNSSDTIYTS